MSHALIAGPPARATPQGQGLRRRDAAAARVLLVEDEPVTAEVFARALQNDGHRVRVARDGLQALHSLRDDPPDVVVLDLGLPNLSGLEVLRRLRAGDHGAIPVVVVSGTAPHLLPPAQPLLAPGCWLEKPLRPRQLVAAVRLLHGD